MKNLKFKVLALFALLTIINASAQFAPEYAKYANTYSEDNKLILSRDVVLNIGIKDGELEIVQENFEENLFLTDGANHASRETLNFSYYFELLEVEASSMAYENGKFKEFKVENFVEKDNLDGSFYDDSKSLVFLYPNLRKGAVSKLKYSEKIKNPRFVGPNFFGDMHPTLKTSYTVIADKDIELQFKKFNMENSGIKYSEEEKRGKKIYSWKSGNLDKIKFEDNAPNFKKIMPHVVPVIMSYETNGEEISISGETKDLYNWYYSLVNDINEEEPAPALVSVVKELIEDKPSELEKVRAMYYWAQENIKYIAYEYALGGFVPREANTVFQRKYGDCKDNSSILKEMLEIAGIKGNLTWIGTRSIPYNYDDMPTPIVDNHMILSYTDAVNQTYYLDATGRYNPLEIPSSFIQGKEALIEDGVGNFFLKRVPVIPADQNMIADTSYIKIQGNNLIGTSTANLTGYGKIDYNHGLESLHSEEKLKEFFSYRFQKGNNTFLIDSLEIFNKGSYDLPLKIDYSYKLQNYIKEFGGEKYVNLNLNREITNYKTKDDRKFEVEYESTRKYVFKTFLDIPEGYAVEYLPEDETLKTHFFEASISYEHMGDQIIYNHIASLDFINLDLEQQKLFNKELEKLEDAYKEVVILKQIVK
ncbi:DUF3857 domain-containing protein [Gramella sp. AN32]|uniref:DUF3857 domain-containing protein n=1 Tax=Christiangramia antarctica TaxID=2058158 RepID=A0ABW5X2F6_9FLAO|nr:DUF3857 domain-containing protein [Gramella sp. AN32]MCM4155680.1 transglutaminase [Gramella sp. AN32]